MKRVLSGLLVVGVMLPVVASAASVSDLWQQVGSLRQLLSALVDIFTINYPGEALGLISGSLATSSTSGATSTITVPCATVGAVKVGDFDRNGSVSLSEVQRVANMSLAATSTPDDIKIADSDGDRRITSVDVSAATQNQIGGSICVMGPAVITPTSTVSMSIVSVSLTSTTLAIDGSRTSYRAVLRNQGTASTTGMAVQGWIEQGTSSVPSSFARRAAGGVLVGCGGTSPAGTLPKGDCSVSFTFGASNTAGGSGTLRSGPATAIFELKQGSAVVATKNVPIQLTGGTLPVNSAYILLDPQLGSSTLVANPGQQGALVGAFMVSSTPGVSIGSISLKTSPQAVGLQNLRVSILSATPSSPFGSIQSTVTPGQVYVFSSPTKAISGQRIYVQGDISTLSPTSTLLQFIQITGCDLNCLPVNGQTLRIDPSYRSTSSITLAVSKNSTVGSQTYAMSQTAAKIGSYLFYASTTEGVNINMISVATFFGSPTSTSPIANLRLMVGTSTQFGTTIARPVSNVSSSFSGTLSIPAGTTKVVDVYADILSGPMGTYPAATAISECSGMGAVTFSSVRCPVVFGQDVTLGGQSNIQVNLDASSPATSQLVMGSTNNSLAVFRFSETSNLEDVKITDLNVFDSVTSTAVVAPSFANLALYQGATLLAATSRPISSQSGKGYYYQFSLATPIIVPRAGSVSIALRGDVLPFATNSSTDNSVHVFKIATSTDSSNDTAAETVVALGRTSSNSSSISLVSPVANSSTVLRTKLTVTASGLGVSTGRPKMAVDDFGQLNFSADAAGDLLLGLVRVTLSGSALSGQPLNTSSVSLYDPTLGQSFPLLSFASSTADFNLNNYVLTAGSSKTFRLRLNSNLVAAGGITANPQQGISQTLSTRINFPTDVNYKTAISGGSTVNLSTNVTPIMINSVTYEQGT